MKFKVSLQFDSWVMFHEDVQSKMKKSLRQRHLCRQRKAPSTPQIVLVLVMIIHSTRKFVFPETSKLIPRGGKSPVRTWAELSEVTYRPR